jgi:methyl-accepting chemotaxis protein
MQRSTPSLRTIPRSYLNSFVRKNALLFACGAFLAAAAFDLFYPEQGTTYAESYNLIAELNSDLINRSLTLFSFTMLLMIAGIIIVSIAYSHRVAGPLHKLGIHTKKIASGKFTESVRLRSDDVVHALADDMNELSGRFRDLLVQVEVKTQLLENSLDDLGQSDSPRTDTGWPATIPERIDELRELLAQIRL